MELGLIQVYCGEGKGKTTAAIGQGIRAIGQGMKVIMIQFLKSSFTGELDTLKKLEPDFKVFRFEKPKDFFWNLNDEEKKELKNEIMNAINFSKKVLDTKECDMLILDEILGVIQNGLLKESEVCELLDKKPLGIEIILTGRYLTDEIRKKANYISNIHAEKHPMNEGIGARKGIEY
ncbi:cob(I)yrinic acid a,c-diamide adenosyltransferase [Defluviitalea phaphyphila]|uniref:cob(I)yrinic acid a,c-diamide adenosyltransferase n=1 Tax=Defluviitalea phaphyphila TaxID=1473580 RepID=UPI0007311027|nr:cob(I)yrinic acid a,c-diamide adenosyltransferase [Defluviitalea phaphyphila]